MGFIESTILRRTWHYSLILRMYIVLFQTLQVSFCATAEVVLNIKIYLLYACFIAVTIV